MAISYLDNLAEAPTRLRNRHQRRLQRFLLEDVDANLFILSWLENHGVEPSRADHFAFWGFFSSSGGLRSISLNIANRLVMLDTRIDDDARRFGLFFGERDLRFLHVVSRSRSVEPFWSVYADPKQPDPVEARLIQHQELYRLQPQNFSFPAIRQSRVRRADASEIDAVFLASARMHREETLEDPLRRDADAFRRHVRYRITHGRTFVWFDEYRRLLFKADISTRCAHGAQISGVYTSPRHRNQGIATRAMIDICSILFEEDLPRLTLYVNEKNHAARHVYQKIGFQYLAPYQTIFIAH